MIALETLLPLTILSSEVNTGRGTLTCRHGVYPVPGPATQELLRGVPVFSNEVEGELTTPTGAALLATLVEGYGPRPAMTVTRSGYGAGSRDTPGSANVLRVSLGSDCRLPGAGLPEDEVAVLETSLDDHSPQTLGHLQEMLLGAGALDVCLIPAQMKKNRPGVMLTVLAPPDREAELARLIFAETTTLGLRRSRQRRFVLERRTAHVETEYGPVGVKCSGYGGRVINCTPEYEDCRRVALERNVALREVMSAAAAAGRRLLGAAGPPSDSGPVTEG